MQVGKKWGYIDKTGRFVINPQFMDAEHFFEGLALIQINSNQYGFIDKTGKFVILRPQSGISHPYFSEGLIVIKAKEKLWIYG